MIEALYIDGVFEHVLEEIISSQYGHPEQVCFLQPYSSRPYKKLEEAPPTPEEPMTLYVSISTDLQHVSYKGQIVGWEDKTRMSEQRRIEVEQLLEQFQPGEGGLYDKGRPDAIGSSVNLLSIRNLRSLPTPFAITELIKDSDGKPRKPRSQPGGFSYIRRRDAKVGLTEEAVIDAGQIAEESHQFDWSSVEEARKRVVALIAHRRGQPKFRRDLLNAYERRCAITGYDATEALEAAHIFPFRGEHTNHVQNGLLLRADIHILFDYGLIGIDPETGMVRVRKELENTQYAELAGKKVFVPRNAAYRPNPELLELHWEKARNGNW